MKVVQSGFTLVELMVTVAVAAILLAVGVPSLKSLYDGYRVQSEISRIEQLLAFARNQAASYGRTVNVCASAGGAVCGTDWNNGVLVYTLDTSGNSKLLKIITGFNSSDVLKGDNLSFRPDGLASNSASFIYCAGGVASGSRSVNVSASGIIKYGSHDQSCS